MSRPGSVSLVAILRRWSHMSTSSVSRWVHANATYAGLVDRRQTRIRRPGPVWPWRRAVRVTPQSMTLTQIASHQNSTTALSVARSHDPLPGRTQPTFCNEFICNNWSHAFRPTTDRCCQRGANTASGRCMTPTVTSPRLIRTDRRLMSPVAALHTNIFKPCTVGLLTIWHILIVKLTKINDN